MADWVEEGGAWYAKEMAYKYEMSDEGRAVSLKKEFGIELSELTRTVGYTDDNCTHYTDTEGRKYWFSRSRNTTAARWNRS
jgi:hypothetical protein